MLPLKKILTHLGFVVCQNNIWVGRVSSVGIATRYELEGPESGFRWWMKLSTPVQTGCDAQPASYATCTGLSWGLERPARGVDHPLYLEPVLKKVYSYTSTPPLSLRGLFLK